jgi:hypothetical protein
MNNKFDELTKQMAQSVSRRAAFKKFGVGLGVIAMALSLALPVAAENPNSLTSSVSDAAGDAGFPYELYGGPVPPWIDIVKASVALTRGVFHFEIQVNTDIPGNGDPGFNPPVNHLGGIFGIQTDRKTATQFNFFGQEQQGNYYFNFLIGVLYFAQDDAGLVLGWHGFVQGPNGFTEIPLVIRGDTYIFEISACVAW